MLNLFFSDRNKTRFSTKNALNKVLLLTGAPTRGLWAESLAAEGQHGDSGEEPPTLRRF